ncbi:MAG: histidine kinase [Sediminibacterium sp.]|nr:histidine kinase [Sediminibacterium sp.]MDP3129381.1 histidine kinase [Sediminibacterium sp.]
MRSIVVVILFVFFFRSSGQFPYVKKLNYPEQLSTQVVYDMLTDKKGYIWLATDKGLFRFNGRFFTLLPFNNTASRAVSYLQEDADGKIWCMNLVNQLFYYQNDSLKKFTVDEEIIKEVSSFNNVVVGSKQLWLHSFKSIYEFDKITHKIIRITRVPAGFDPITASGLYKDKYYAFANRGLLFSSNAKKTAWINIKQSYSDPRFTNNDKKMVILNIGLERALPLEINGETTTLLPSLVIAPDVYIFLGTCINDNEYWLCTQNGAYRWDKKTGRTNCFFPNQRVSDVIKDYQGNYWFSTLDNGVFICPSLDNTLMKIYNDPLFDNFKKLEILPNGELLAGNSQGLMAKLNLESKQVFKYDLSKQRETEFITYDTASRVIITNRGVFKQNRKAPVETSVDYSKGVARDKYGNLIIAVFKGAYIMNDRFGSDKRLPKVTCPLYEMYQTDTLGYGGRGQSFLLRAKRSLTALGSVFQNCFWVAYEDGLYEYHYDGTIKILKDENGGEIIANSLQLQNDGSLVAGTSTKGVLFIRNGKIVKTYNTLNGLSSVQVRKVLIQDQYVWVLTAEGVDRIDTSTNRVSSYLEKYGLSNIVINDFILEKNNMILATPNGILLRQNAHKPFDFELKFPMMKAISNGTEIANWSTLPDNSRDINFYFEALHYISPSALTYQYRLIGIDTIWRQVTTLSNQLAFNRLASGKYSFEIKAIASKDYVSTIHRFSFTVPKLYWQKAGFISMAVLVAGLVLWIFLHFWKIRLLNRQLIKEKLLKSQLVALRAQMNPHFLYNVLNTVQGLVYGNRKTEASALLGNFSDLMRKTLQASDKQVLSLKDEIENIRLYLELEKARFDKGFTYQIEMIHIDDLSEMYIPSLLLQPFAENSVKHGLMHKQGEKKLLIRFEKMPDGLSVIIDDNGIGRTQSHEINKRSKGKPVSFATAALTERMELFNQLYKQKITCEIVDKKDNQGLSLGTRVTLFIPDYGKDNLAL